MNTPPPPWATYGAPAPPPGYPNADEPRGMTLKVFGILSMVFAGLNAMSASLSIVQAALGSSAPPPPPTAATPELVEMQAAMADYTEVALKVAAVEGGVMLLMDIALFVIGILLVQRRDLGRKMSIAWAVAAFVVLAGRGAAFEIVVWPKFRRFIDGMGSGFAASGATGAPSGMFGFFSGFAHGAQYLTLIFMAIYPIVLLSFMAMKATRSQVRLADQPGGALS